MKNMFNPYVNVIKKAIDKDPKFSQKLFSKNIKDRDFDLSYLTSLRAELPSWQDINESSRLIKGLDVESTLTNKLSELGSHPDFSYLKETGETENHWIITGFVDVKKSTQMFNRFTKSTVALITEGIVKASIFAVNLCGGYVHRIQGDGLMVYFGGKNHEKSNAIKDALKAFSLISYFVKNDLKEYFEQKGINNIHTRAALDIGFNNQVLWHYSGIGNSGEVTTCSLYTSLVPKMQSHASVNGVVVGQQVVNQIENKKYFEEKNKPIWDFEDGRTYSQYDFDWERFIVDNDLAVQDINGQLFLKNDDQNSNLVPSHLSSIAIKNKPYFGGV